MTNLRGILVIGIIEILIGGLTLIGTLGSLVLTFNTKTPNVLFFVIITAAASTLIGLGILRFKKEAYRLLLYFSSVILLSKALILLGIIHLNGALTPAGTGDIKEIISFLYHGYLIYYLRKEEVALLFS